jgi:cysteinylglycine-S-conjugate dipeptidase
VQLMQKALQYLEKNFDTYLEDLKELVRIPSVSFPGFPAEEVKRSAHAVKALMEKRGLENVRLIEFPGAHPYVYGERIKSPGRPTLLLYAHHDVQPPGREEVWKTSPFEPTVKKGPGGDRLYARGVADDKAGVIVHTSAIDAILKTYGELPVNIKLIVEGEEETGSEHLFDFLKKHKKELAADIMVLTDTTNFDCGVPALTVALRGMVVFTVEVKGLAGTVHSGMWGGPVPDPVMALNKMLAKLVDDDGKLAIPGIYKDVKVPTKKEKEEFKKIPYDEKTFRKQTGMISSAEVLWDKNAANPLVQLWTRPSLTINAIQASSRKQASNIINDVAWARFSIRLVADMDPEKVSKQVQDYLKKITPWGLETKTTGDAHAPAWSTETTHRAFEAAEKALTAGYGVPPLKIGCGGTIPFVRPFADALGGAPALLIGVEDPYTNAHGENESLLISDLKKSCLSQIHLFGNL